MVFLPYLQNFSDEKYSFARIDLCRTKNVIITRSSIFLIAFVCFAFAKAQEPPQDSDGVWNQLFITSHLTEKLDLKADVQYRTHLIYDDFDHFIARAGLELLLNDAGASLQAGYGYFITGMRGASTETMQEHRLHQDLNFYADLGLRLIMDNRLRVEERFVSGQDFSLRFRYLLDFKLPINHSTLKQNTLYLVAWNEAFINAEEQSGVTGVSRFDRNWFFLGAGFKFRSGSMLQLGYMYETTDAGDNGQYVVTYSMTI